MMRWNSTKTYTEEDILRMQQEAVNRVHEFQQRTQSYYDTPVIGEIPQPVVEAQSHIVPEPTSPACSADFVSAGEGGFSSQALAEPAQMNHPQDPVQGLAEKFGLDSETLLILGLMFLLYNEKADHSLLLALAYLLLS